MELIKFLPTNLAHQQGLVFSLINKVSVMSLPGECCRHIKPGLQHLLGLAYTTIYAAAINTGTKCDIVKRDIQFANFDDS